MLEAQRLALGIEPIRAKQSNMVKATQTAVDEMKAHSTLEQWAVDYVNYLERCVQTAFDWAGLQKPVEVDMTTDLRNSHMEIETLLKARSQGDLSPATLWDEMK